MDKPIVGVVVHDLKKHADPRGWLSEAWRHDQVDYLPAMAYVSWTKPNVSRGPHEHVAQSDFFVFLWGTFRVQLWDRRPESPTKGAAMTFEAGQEHPCSVVIPPGVVHAYTCTSPEGGLVINLPDKLYAGIGHKDPVDEIRHEADPKSPYQVVPRR